MKNVWLSTVALIVSGLLMASCANTIRGAGEDIKDSAQAVEDVAE
ncbi:MAG TPA: hypothetical protein VMF90_03415 [Rhizobiaceae bacterium]|nr:hypothetical protein [Rhizobiaceae bacterium]